MSALVPFPTQVVSLRYARSGFEAIPKDLSGAELLRYFTYSEQDRQQIFQCRGAHNQIGFALLLSGVRLTGRFPHDFDMLPRRFLQHLCQQLNLDAPLFLNYPQREPTRREHIARLREYLGLRSFAHEDQKLIIRHVTERVRGGERQYELLASAERMLRSQRIILPGVTTLEKLIRAARTKAEDDLYQEIVMRIDEGTRTKMLALLEPVEGQMLSPFQQLQQAAGLPSPEALGAELDALEQVRGIMPEKIDLRDFNPHLVERLADLVSGSPTQTMLRYVEPKRSALMLCWLWRLRTQLKENLRALEKNVPENPKLEIRDDQFHVARLEKLTTPKSARELKRRIQRMLQSRHLPDLLQEAQGWTNFLSAFTRASTGRPVTGEDIAEQLKLLTCLIAEGCNIGLAQMALHGPGLTYDQLEEAHFNYIREETLQLAAAALVNFHLSQWLPAAWGQGFTSSSDARMYGVPVRALNATYHPHYFASAGRGIGVYTHVSDLWIPFYTQIITCHVRQAPYMLDGLLYHGTRLEPKEHYTDTHGYTDGIFGISHVLGIRFCPRIKDLPEQRLWRLPGESYRHIENVFAGKINVGLIRESWDEILRLVASIKCGEVRASLIVSKASAASHRNKLYRGLQELGRLVKTAYIAEYLCVEELRRRVLLGLNKGESMHKLAGRVRFGQQGEFRDRTYEDQLNSASSMNLLLAAIVVWNTIHLQGCLKKLRADGYEYSEEDLRFLSPLMHRHLGIYGRYQFSPDILEGLPSPEDFTY